MGDSSLDLGDHSWQNLVLHDWNEDAGNLGDKASRKFDINIIWVEVDLSLGDGQVKSLLWCWDSSLFGEVHLEVDIELLDNDIDSSGYGDNLLKFEITFHSCLDSSCSEFSTIGCLQKIQIDS